MPSPMFEAFRETYIKGNEAFNRGDFMAAFGGLSPEFEWWPAEYFPHSEIARGSDAISALFADLFSVFPGWRSVPREFIEISEKVILIHLDGSGVGVTSNAPAEFEFSQVWEFRDGVPVRCREFTDRAQALAAAAE